MSLKGLLKFGSRLLRGKKESATPTTGQQTKLLTYEGKGSQATGQELAVKELKDPPIVLKKTQALQMGDDTAPAFGSSTYDWVMKKGRGKYTADEWVDHLTSTRKENFKVFGKPSTRTIRADKRFKYDSGPFVGKEVNISKEELFDTNLAVFNEAGDLTGGILAAAKKFGIKFDANEIGSFIKLNPLNRLRPIELGTPANVMEKVTKKITEADDILNKLFYQFKNQGNEQVAQTIANTRYSLAGLKNTPGDNSALIAAIDDLKFLRNAQSLQPDQKKAINKIIGEITESVSPLKNTKTFYKNETNYTLQGGKDYKETIMGLDEPIISNTRPFNTGGHFSEVLPKEFNNIYHVRFDTRFTPEGKKVFMINEIQSDVNQKIAKQLSKFKQLDGVNRTNPFQKDIELQVLLGERVKLADAAAKALDRGDNFTASTLTNQLAKISKEIKGMSKGKFDYFPMVEADQYGDHSLKYLLQKAARENVDYVAVAPFDKLSFRQGYKKGNERFYGYASGKGINKSGTAVLPNLMKKVARLYGSQAGPIKMSLSDPKLTYKKIAQDTFKYPKEHKLSGKSITSTYHSDAVKDPKAGYKLVLPDNPNLYFDGFAIKVNQLMRGTQKTYKRAGGLVVDIFKPMRYNRTWL